MVQNDETEHEHQQQMIHAHVKTKQQTIRSVMPVKIDLHMRKISV